LQIPLRNTRAALPVLFGIVYLYACETWACKESRKLKLLKFEKKILRKHFKPTKEADITWRINTNDERNMSIRNRNVINYIQAQRLSWLGHIHRMPDDGLVKKLLNWKPIASRPQGRQRKKKRDGKMMY
jgi:hypothetical protein